MRGEDDEADNEEEVDVEEEGLAVLEEEEEEEEEEGVPAVPWDRLPPHRVLKNPERLLGIDEVKRPRGETLLVRA